MVKVGIIGGSGLDDPKILSDYNEKEVENEYGKPSSKLTIGKIKGIDVVIIARHGKNHSIMPTKVNFRANIKALKDCGCTHILATTAVGSLREEIKPGNLVFPNQFIDFTRKRELTFFENEIKHTAMPDPFDKRLRELLVQSCRELGFEYNTDKTVITIEGPRFSTKAESKMFRSWGADVINMSIAPEAILANEVGIKYAAVAMSTDFDSWKSDEEAVTWDKILKVFNSNVDKVKNLLINAIPKIKDLGV